MNYSINLKGDIHLEGNVQNVICGSCGNILGKRNEDCIFLYTKGSLISRNGETIMARCGQCRCFADVSKPGSTRVMV